MARKTAFVWVVADTADMLHAQDRAEAVTEVCMRLHALWRLCLGEDPPAVATLVGGSRNAVQEWLRWYRCGEVAEVRAHRQGGPGQPSHLAPDQEAQLVVAAATRVFGTAQAVRDWIEAQFGVVYAYGSLYTLLGIRLKIPRPRHTQTAP